MRRNLIERGGRSIADAWLTASVHLDAFRFDAAAYLTAAKWWVRRKRVRARGQLAPLLSQSPKAYRLWALRQSREGAACGPGEAVPPIIALVDTASCHAPGARAARKALDATLRSLADEGIPAWPITTDRVRELAAACAAIDWTAGPWLMPVVAGDRIAPGTANAYRIALRDRAASGPLPGVLYADDDLLDRRRRRTSPHFKPCWNGELFRHHDYLTGACILRADADDMPVAAKRSDWAQQLVAQGLERGPAVHVRRMLHHRNERIAPRIPAAPAIAAADLPPVTVIVPTRNHLALLRTCLDGLDATDYPDFDVIVVDNDSDDPDTLAYLAQLDPSRHRVMRHSGPFNFSTINNRAAAVARGQLLCLLNNDIEVMSPNWLAIMAIQAMRDDVGAVGARLLYPDGRIQHAGVVIGVGNAAGHAHRFVQKDEEGYFQRHALPQFCSAVTAACLVVQRARFEAVHGLDERNFAVAFNDVDLCLRLNQRGWQSLYEPRATLIHHESVSRGLDRDPVGAARFAGELAALQRIWKTDQIVDPWHHPQLSRAAERFAIAI